MCSPSHPQFHHPPALASLWLGSQACTTRPSWKPRSFSCDHFQYFETSKHFKQKATMEQKSLDVQGPSQAHTHLGPCLTSPSWKLRSQSPEHESFHGYEVIGPGGFGTL